MLHSGALLAILTYIVTQGTCINIYSCKPRECEVHLRIEPGWMCGRLRYAENGRQYASFRGVPYGTPPLGDKRFKELEPVRPFPKNFLLDATEDSPACPQSTFIYGRIPLLVKGMSEDCIYLNLHVPSRSLPRYPFPAKTPGIPILVFIHGGAFHGGSGLTDGLGPEFLMTKDVAVITFNYRINVFGFLSLDSEEIPGNQGLRDMVTLLRWVQRNARAFGGDPNNVTLMGQSSGATCAHILSLSNATKGLFKRLILQSCTGFPSYFTTSPKMAKHAADMFLKELGINQTDPTLIHQQLIKTPLLKIMQANSAVQFKSIVVTFNPIIESKNFTGLTILDDDPASLMAHGRGREYPQLLSYTDNEMAFSKWVIHESNMLYLLKENPKIIVSPRLQYTLPEKEVEEIADKIKERYFCGKPGDDELIEYLSDMYLKHPALKVAEWRAASGTAPTYMYKFAHDFDYSPIKEAHWMDYRGSAHMDDLSCVFRVNSMLGNRITYPPKNRDDTLIYWMVYLVTNFMTCGNPTCNAHNGNALWPPVSNDCFKYNLITEAGTINMMEPTAEERNMVNFFDSFDPESRYVSNMVERQQSVYEYLKSLWKF